MLILSSLKFSVLAENYYSMDTKTLKTGISMNELVPQGMMGAWRVRADLVDCTNPEIFKLSSLDIWNLSRVGDVIKLVNPFTGAEAVIDINYVEGNTVRFTKNGDYDKKKLTDIVEITLIGDSFYGENTLKLETISGVDNKIIKVEEAKYKLSGEKISGMSIF